MTLDKIDNAFVNLLDFSSIIPVPRPVQTSRERGAGRIKEFPSTGPADGRSTRDFPSSSTERRISLAAQDYYKTLGITRTATEKDVKSAFRKLARKFHPDVNPGDKTAESKFKEINEAYEVLSDASSRAKYDRYGSQWKHADAAEARRPGPTPGARAAGARTRARTVRFDFDDLAQGNGGDAGFGDIFGRIFNQPPPTSKQARPKQPQKGEDVEHSSEISLEEAFSGTTRILEITTDEQCPDCAGSGRVGSKPCAQCYATGVIRKPRRIEVKVPPGVITGSKVRVAGAGSAGVSGGGRGDLLLVVTVKPHDRFERKGDDLYTDIEVPVVDAVLGGEVGVPTLRSRLALKIPAETQNGKVFRLGGQGMPKLGASEQRGDLYAKVNVVLPTKLNDRQKALFEQLRAAS